MKFEKLSVVVPCFNEEVTIEELINRVKYPARYDLELEIIVGDGGSTDGSNGKIRLLASNSDSIKFIEHPVSQGKGAALPSGLTKASGKIVLIQDTDLEYDPNEYPALLGAILEGKADVVFGSRFSGGSFHRVLYFWHYIGNKILNLISNMFTDLNLTDMKTCFKIFRREII